MGNFTTAKATTFFDIETTHLDPSRSAVLEISIITDWDSGSTDTWTTKIKPRPVELKFALDVYSNFIFFPISNSVRFAQRY